MGLIFIVDFRQNHPIEIPKEFGFVYSLNRKP